MLDVRTHIMPKITMTNAAAPTQPIDAMTNDSIETLTAIRVLTAPAERGDRHAQEVLRRFDRGEPVDDLGVPSSWPTVND